jgi:hypothetical protein
MSRIFAVLKNQRFRIVSDFATTGKNFIYMPLNASLLGMGYLSYNSTKPKISYQAQEFMIRS